MKKFAALLIIIGGLLAACVAYEVPNTDGGPYYGSRDRDGDGVRNSQDRRPDDPRRY